MFNKKRIEARQRIRAAISQNPELTRIESALLLVSESVDDYIDLRIDADKVLEGILKDIQFDIASINTRQEIEGTIADETDPANTR